MSALLNPSDDQLKIFISNNIDQLLKHGGFIGAAYELYKVSMLKDTEYKNNNRGYDYKDPETGLRYELKVTTSIVNKQLRIQHFTDKEGMFDYMEISDRVNKRAFLVPHDDLFNLFDIDAYGHMYWSASYNLTDNIRWSNTHLLLKYEV